MINYYLRKDQHTSNFIDHEDDNNYIIYVRHIWSEFEMSRFIFKVQQKIYKGQIEPLYSTLTLYHMIIELNCIGYSKMVIIVA